MIVCRAGNTTPTEIPNATFTDVPLNKTDYASTGMHSDTVDNNRIYTTEDGLFDVHGAGSLDAGGGAIRMLLIQKNGTSEGGATIAVNSSPPVGDGNYHSIEVNGRGIPLLATDYVNMLVYHDAGEPIDLEGAEGEDFTPILYLVKVGELPSTMDVLGLKTATKSISKAISKVASRVKPKGKRKAKQ
jgi:hypothetical protein